MGLLYKRYIPITQSHELYHFLSHLVSGQLWCQNQFIMTCGDILSTGQIQGMDGIRHGALNIWTGRLSKSQQTKRACDLHTYSTFDSYDMNPSMTQLLTHTIAHSTRPSFSLQDNNQPTKKFLILEVSWVKVV